MPITGKTLMVALIDREDAAGVNDCAECPPKFKADEGASEAADGGTRGMLIGGAGVVGGGGTD